MGNAVKDFLWLTNKGLEGILVNSRKSRLNGKKKWEIAWDIDSQPKDERKTTWHDPSEFDVLVDIQDVDDCAGTNHLLG